MQLRSQFLAEYPFSESSYSVACNQPSTKNNSVSYIQQLIHSFSNRRGSRDPKGQLCHGTGNSEYGQEPGESALSTQPVAVQPQGIATHDLSTVKGDRKGSHKVTIILNELYY